MFWSRRRKLDEGFKVKGRDGAIRFFRVGQRADYAPYRPCGTSKIEVEILGYQQATNRLVLRLVGLRDGEYAQCALVEPERVE